MPRHLRALHQLDLADAAHLVEAGQAQREALCIGAAGAADAVDVQLRVGRGVDVDHRLELRDVEPARGHVGRDQHRAAAVRELHQHLVALALLELAVQRERGEALRVQHVGEVAALLLGVAERDRAGRPEVLQQQRHGVQAFVLLDLVETLLDLRGIDLRAHLHLFRRTKELLRELRDVLGVGRREQQRLAVLRAQLRDAADVGGEAHVEHAIGLVEHQCVQRGEAQRAAVEVVEHAPRRADDDVRAVLQALGLVAQRHAAAQRERLHVVFAARESADLGGDLVGELACRAQHQRLHRERLGLAVEFQLGQQRERERGGLAAAGLRLHDQVVAGERERQARRLHRRHREVAERDEVGELRRRQRQRRERQDAGRGLACSRGGRIGAGHPRLSRAGDAGAPDAADGVWLTRCSDPPRQRRAAALPILHASVGSSSATL